jgi:hypothetical protein
MTLWSKPVNRRLCLAMSCGSNIPPRSRETAIATGPSSVSTVFPFVPLL